MPMEALLKLQTQYILKKSQLHVWSALDKMKVKSLWWYPNALYLVHFNCQHLYSLIFQKKLNNKISQLENYFIQLLFQSRYQSLILKIQRKKKNKKVLKLNKHPRFQNKHSWLVEKQIKSNLQRKSSLNVFEVDLANFQFMIVIEHE